MERRMGTTTARRIIGANGRHGRIRIGWTREQQQAEIARYVAEQDITRVYVFAPPRFPLPLVGLPEGVHAEAIAYADIIMYKVFYPLLEVIDAHTLLIFHQCLRTRNRSDLTYNCAHHYANQTPHVFVYEPFPFIEEAQDCSILLDYQAPGKYKGRSFDTAFLADEDVRVTPRHFTIEVTQVTPTAQEIARYEAQKERMFATLGQGDPDTIPRRLHIAAGAVKRQAMTPDGQYVARNSRFHLPNVTLYADAQPGVTYTILDFPHRRLEFNDFLTVTGMTTIRLLHSELRVDDYYLGEVRAWVARLEAFYASCPTDAD